MPPYSFDCEKDKHYKHKVRMDYIYGCSKRDCLVCGPTLEYLYDENRRHLLRDILPERLVNNFVQRVREPSVTHLSKEIGEKYLTKQVLEMYQYLQKCIADGYAVIAGGFCPFLEGLTGTFNDIDIFIVVSDMSTIYPRKMKRILEAALDPGSEGIVQQIKPNKHYPWIGHAYVLYFNVKNKDKEETDFNIVVKQTSSPFVDWFSAAKSITHKFDIDLCASALTQDGTRVIRFAPPRAGVREAVRRELKAKQRSRKYKNRQIGYGNPDSLLKLAWLSLPSCPDCPKTLPRVGEKIKNKENKPKQKKKEMKDN